MCDVVSNPREAALDSEFLAICSQFAAEQANRLSTQMRTYDVPSYIHRLGLFLRGKLTINDAGLAEGPDEDEAALRRNRERRRGDEENGEAEEGEEDVDDDAQLLRWPELGALVVGFAQSTPSLDCLYVCRSSFHFGSCHMSLTFAMLQGRSDGSHTEGEEGEGAASQEGEARRESRARVCTFCFPLR